MNLKLIKAVFIVLAVFVSQNISADCKKHADKSKVLKPKEQILKEMKQHMLDRGKYRKKRLCRHKKRMHQHHPMHNRNLPDELIIQYGPVMPGDYAYQVDPGILMDEIRRRQNLGNRYWHKKHQHKHHKSGQPCMHKFKQHKLQTEHVPAETP